MDEIPEVITQDKPESNSLPQGVGDIVQNDFSKKGFTEEAAPVNETSPMEVDSPESRAPQPENESHQPMDTETATTEDDTVLLLDEALGNKHFDETDASTAVVNSDSAQTAINENNTEDKNETGQEASTSVDSEAPQDKTAETEPGLDLPPLSTEISGFEPLEQMSEVIPDAASVSEPTVNEPLEPPSENLDGKYSELDLGSSSVDAPLETPSNETPAPVALPTELTSEPADILAVSPTEITHEAASDLEPTEMAPETTDVSSGVPGETNPLSTDNLITEIESLTTGVGEIQDDIADDILDSLADAPSEVQQILESADKPDETPMEPTQETLTVSPDEAPAEIASEMQPVENIDAADENLPANAVSIETPSEVETIDDDCASKAVPLVDNSSTLAAEPETTSISEETPIEASGLEEASAPAESTSSEQETPVEVSNAIDLVQVPDKTSDAVPGDQSPNKQEDLSSKTEDSGKIDTPPVDDSSAPNQEKPPGKPTEERSVRKEVILDLSEDTDMEIHWNSNNDSANKNKAEGVALDDKIMEVDEPSQDSARKKNSPDNATIDLSEDKGTEAEKPVRDSDKPNQDAGNKGNSPGSTTNYLSEENATEAVKAVSQNSGLKENSSANATIDLSKENTTEAQKRNSPENATIDLSEENTTETGTPVSKDGAQKKNSPNNATIDLSEENATEAEKRVIKDGAHEKNSPDNATIDLSEENATEAEKPTQDSVSKEKAEVVAKDAVKSTESVPKSGSSVSAERRKSSDSRGSSSSQRRGSPMESDLQISSVQGSVNMDLDITKTTQEESGPKSTPAKVNSQPATEKGSGTPTKTGGQKTSEPSAKEGKKGKNKPPQTCIVCKTVGKCKYNIVRNGDIKHLCDDVCFKAFKDSPSRYLTMNEQQSEVKCVTCAKSVPEGQGLHDRVDGKKVTFCDKTCFERHYQSRKTTPVEISPVPDGTSAVKKCAICTKTLTRRHLTRQREGLEIPLCGQACEKVFIDMNSAPIESNKAPTGKQMKGKVDKDPNVKYSNCPVCHKVAAVKHEVNFNNVRHTLCSDMCFAAFRYVNKLSMNACDFCQKPVSGSNSQTIQFEGKSRKFCNQRCLSDYKLKETRLVPCTWCQTKKTNFDMVERLEANNKYQMFCTLNCLSLFRVNMQATSNSNVQCDQCKKYAPAQYHLTMSDASVRNFCQYACVMAFQSQFAAQASTPPANSGPAAPVTPSTRQSARVAAKTTTPKGNQKTSNQNARTSSGGEVPIISNVVSLADDAPDKAPQPTPTKQVRNQVNQSTPAPPPPPPPAPTVVQQVVVQPPQPKAMRNKSLMCRPFMQTKATSCRPLSQSKKVQTDEVEEKQVLIPVPVPIYVPVPMAMYNIPVPYPVPMPIPIPVPCFIPTTKKSAAGIMKEIKKIQERLPSDPFEAELLAMAEAIATEGGKAADDSDSDSDHDPIDTSNVISAADGDPASSMLGEDMISMALRMASEMSEPAMDLETSLNPSQISTENDQFNSTAEDLSLMNQDINTPSTLRRGRSAATEPSPPAATKRKSTGGRGRPKKQPKVEYQEPQPEPQQQQIVPAAPAQPAGPPPDSNFHLKFTYGVNAWKHWVLQKNMQLEQQSTPRGSKVKTFQSDLLSCSAEELNRSLCLFVKEVRKPNGDEYAPDSIYYLCLGIQQYIFENGRVDNIFTDDYYERFTDELHDVLQRYEVRLNAQGLIVCRIEAEHLWEAKSLGAHSPHVLLNTLIYFNTKYFMLRTTDEHCRLSFSHIMKHWKKTGAPGKQQGRTVYLRYYSQQQQPAITDKKSKKKQQEDETIVYEQAENVQNPLRCPVKLYEFYLSKCPEAIKNRNDVFYLVPERSCVPDSPVWYSTASLGGEALGKMLTRIRVVKEIQEAHLHHQPY